MADFINPKSIKHIKFLGEDFFLPKREDDILLHFKEIILVQSSYITFFSFLILAIYEFSIGLTISSLVSVAMAVMNVLILLYLKTNNKFGIVASMHIFLVWAKVTFILLETGGIDSNMLLWYILVITLAFEYIDDRFGLAIWLFFIVISISAIIYLSKTGFLLSTKQLPLHYEILYNLLFLMIFMAVLFIYINERKIYQKELVHRTANLQARNEEYVTAMEELSLQNQIIKDLNDRLEDKQQLILNQVEVMKNLMKNHTEAIAYLNKQKSVLTGYLNELEESVKYAKALEKFLLCDSGVLSEFFLRYVIMNNQKYLVGGDFYFIHPIDENRVFVFVGDATGHSSAGSILASIVRILLARLMEQKVFMPNIILDRLRKEIYELFDVLANGKIFYGIKAIAFLFDKKDYTLQVSDAGLSFIIAGEQLEEIKPQNLLIASYAPFQEARKKTYTLSPNNKLFLFTDGYYIQLNNEYQKFTKKRFKNLLMRIHTQPLFVQKDILEFEHLQWKKNMEQTDDITIIALQV